ncbi:NAD-dependent epimerase/dehydratase family protein [Agrococcus carbonis]|uniref:Nucleoside-diphosphate-sugar epimerase n=1 Tax=Agrococcus carbonis TaxID=684552 RepID=A0A1H1PTP1_9MICO|nr:NAD-dependent epimerase/dehydratase family protein [Agrococcus carbonis]SDS14530.1 Nucleoside-diphosphate-sugar epimerase [Agrococcus carbonis]
MRVFLTGASGYIGGSVARRLLDDGLVVRGLTRDAGNARALREMGIEPVVGELDDLELLRVEAIRADAVVHCAHADHRASADALVSALEGTGKPLVHTSGSSVVGDDVKGARLSEAIYDEASQFPVDERKRARQELNDAVLSAASRGVRSSIVCPSLIYGTGRGIRRDSIQVPFLVEQAMRSGVVRVVGRGVNRWSTVHIDDLADLYSRVLAHAPAGAFYFAEHGESSFAEIGVAIADRLGLGEVQSWDADEAAERWGAARAYFTFGSNSRVRAVRARDELGWAPRHGSVLRWIREDLEIDEEGAPHGA